MRAITVLAFHFHKTRQVVKCCRRILIIFKLQVGVNFFDRSLYLSAC